MTIDLLKRVSSAALVVGLGVPLSGCGDSGGAETEGATTAASGVTITGGITITGGGTSAGSESDSAPTSMSTTSPKLDLPDDDDVLPSCGGGDGKCNQLDLLFVIDNSGTMGEEQVNLAANFPLLIEQIAQIKDKKGNLINPDVNIMVTTTDMGHPGCTQFQKPDYVPAKGEPISSPCTDRLERFISLDKSKNIQDACTNACSGVAPDGPFIRYKVNGASNVPGDDIAGALSCIGLQGIDGCGYEAQLESMMQALNPGKEWNMGSFPFMREGAVLAIVMVTDEADCSVLAPEGYKYFEKGMANDPTFNQYWNIHPTEGNKEVTSAVCWNGGVNCVDADNDGIYESCSSSDKGVLHSSTERYVKYLRDVLITQEQKEVIMLGILGVPEVTKHNESAPYEPIEGGVHALQYRRWKDGAYPGGDILPGDSKNAAWKEFEFGVGPGCTGADGQGNFTGQAIPPVRIKEVCESLNEGDKIRCCIESICDDDFSNAIRCLSGLLEESFGPIG